MMNRDRLDLRDLARSVLTEMRDRHRVALMAEMAAALSGPRALDLLSQLRATASLRMQEIIDERYPLHELAEACGDTQAVHVRLIGADFADRRAEALAMIGFIKKQDDARTAGVAR